MQSSGNYYWISSSDFWRNIWKMFWRNQCKKILKKSKKKILEKYLENFPKDFWTNLQKNFKMNPRNPTWRNSYRNLLRDSGGSCEETALITPWKKSEENAVRASDRKSWKILKQNSCFKQYLGGIQGAILKAIQRRFF